ncbi:unnamed protein product [Didymodactylos carnosus]|uniref:Uncharacterized protein n=1 Tax=Didymodactylos carnosus TaxID=1234261 RepID=A0A8S2D4W8_9BILA|nr:unnamed protein product [Didymodactylos carnosus]CAF3587097.1 unnamed protein product [Didymodactylos carnosus]
MKSEVMYVTDDFEYFWVLNAFLSSFQMSNTGKRHRTKVQQKKTMKRKRTITESGNEDINGEDNVPLKRTSDAAEHKPSPNEHNKNFIDQQHQQHDEEIKFRSESSSGSEEEEENQKIEQNKHSNGSKGVSLRLCLITY